MSVVYHGCLICPNGNAFVSSFSRPADNAQDVKVPRPRIKAMRKLLHLIVSYTWAHHVDHPNRSRQELVQEPMVAVIREKISSSAFLAAQVAMSRMCLAEKDRLVCRGFIEAMENERARHSTLFN